VNLAEVIALHRSRHARATIVLTPVENPSAYGLVETDAEGNVRRFLEKPDPSQITCNTINAGIYVLERETLDRIPRDTAWSIERSYFPSLVERGETFVAYVERGYWIDIGTPAKYLQVHHDIMDGRFVAPPFDAAKGRAWISPEARVDEAATVEGPCFIADGAIVKAGARIRPYSVLGRQCHVEEDAVVERSIVWANGWVGREARVASAILGRHCHVGRNATVAPGMVLGDKSVLTDFTRYEGAL
jgi:NDP-sugar pyrophosphorylase family protein